MKAKAIIRNAKATKRKSKTAKRKANSLAARVGRALRRAQISARKTARMYGTPIYFWRDGKVVAEKP